MKAVAEFRTKRKDAKALSILNHVKTNQLELRPRMTRIIANLRMKKEKSSRLNDDNSSVSPRPLLIFIRVNSRHPRVN